MSILYERKDSPLLEESPIYMCVCVLFVIEKNQTCLMKVTLVPFIALEVPIFMEGEKVHMSSKYLFLIRIKYL
jgi:hypothetical protein